MDENMKARPARGLVRRNDAPKGKDTIPAYLSNGEYVLPKATVDAMGGPKALDKLVSATNGKAPGGQPVERSTAPFKGGLHRRDPLPAPKLGLRGFNSGGMTSPMADAQADYQQWLKAGGVTTGYDAGGAVKVKEEKKPAAVDVMTGAAPVPASGSYAEQRNYARQTGALNVPAEKPPAPVPALPASSTLTRGSADWSRSVAAEQAAKQKPAFDKLVEQRSRPGLMPDARTPIAPAPDAQKIRSARSDYTSEKDKAVARLAGQGYSMRDVPNAKGVQRLTGKDGRTIYTNDLADTADWVSGGMKPGVNTVAASNFTNPAAAVSRIIGPALQAAADRGDFGAIRSHYQRGGGTFRGETANQTALRRLTEPSGSVMIGADDKQAADQLAAKIGSMTNDAQGMIRRGDVKGAAVMDRLIGNRRDILGQMNDRILSRREGVERGREAAVDRLMRTEELSARSRDEAAARERDRRLLALEDRVINARTPEELARAAETLRMLTGRQDRQSVQMSYTSTKDPVSGEEVRTPVAYDPNSGTWQRMPGGGATGQFIEGKVYVDANGNRATYKNGAWVPA